MTHENRSGSGERERITKVTRLVDVNLLASHGQPCIKQMACRPWTQTSSPPPSRSRSRRGLMLVLLNWTMHRLAKVNADNITTKLLPQHHLRYILQHLGPLHSLITYAAHPPRCHDHICLRVGWHFKLDSPRVFFTTQEQQPIPLAV